MGYLDIISVHIMMDGPEHVLLASTQGGMLQDMRHTSVVGWIRLEGNGENIVLVVSVDVEILGTSPVVLKLISSQLQLRHMFLTLQCEAMQRLAQPDLMV